MSGEWDETCLVCCEKTKNRCSKCAEAGIDLFFCSAECQKLIWSVHKRVCGPGKANPFVWPCLSDDELREILEHMNETTGNLVDYEPDSNTVAKALQHGRTIPLADVGLVIMSYAQGARTNANHDRFLADQLVLTGIRALEHARTASSTESLRRGDPLARSYAWNAASHWDVYDAHDPLTTEGVEHGAESWRTELRHYVLAFYTVLSIVYADHHGDASISFLKHRQRIASSIRTSVAATNPMLAAKLLKLEQDVDQAAGVAESFLRSF
ncbi:hypothetical protein JCM9279_006551 [Rhodotorula babjevae]